MNPTLATLLVISVAVIAAVLVLILIFLVPVLLQIRRTAHEAEKLIDSVHLQVVPVSHDVTAISVEAKKIIQSIHRQVDLVGGGIETVYDMAVRVKQFELRIAEPLLHLVKVFVCMKRGVDAFARIIFR
jgi:uncharacterized protein YoxC